MLFIICYIQLTFKQMTLKELREKRKKAEPFFSDCCKKSFVGKSNGLYTYYVCECGKKQHQ